MIKRNFHYRLLPIAVALVLAGCSLSPDYTRPAAPVPQTYPNASEGLQDENAVPAAELGWRQFFRDPQLKALIEIALVNNRDMRVAIERVEESRALYGIQQSDRFPTIGAGANASLQRMPEPVSYTHLTLPTIYSV